MGDSGGVTTIDDYLAGFDGDPGYLDWAGFGPISPTVRAEVFADADLLGSGRASSNALVSERFDEARDLVAELIGIDPALVTLQPSATHGLQHALYGLAGTVMASSAEVPAITVTLERAARFSGDALQARWISPADSFVTPEAVGEALDDDDVRALVVSHVDFRTGYRADLAALREVIGSDRILIVDAVQSFGIVDDDLSIADVVVGNGYGWLRSARGTGFASFSPLARERIEPVLSGFVGVEGGMPLDNIPAPAASARAYAVNHPDQLAVARLAVGLRGVREVSPAVIEKRISERVDRILEIVDPHGIPVQTPRDEHRRAGIVTLIPHAPGALAAVLTNAGVVATPRGNSIRLSAHAGTSDETLRMLDEGIRTFISMNA